MITMITHDEQWINRMLLDYDTVTRKITTEGVCEQTPSIDTETIINTILAKCVELKILPKNVDRLFIVALEENLPMFFNIVLKTLDTCKDKRTHNRLSIYEHVCVDENKPLFLKQIRSLYLLCNTCNQIPITCRCSCTYCHFCSKSVIVPILNQKWY